MSMRKKIFSQNKLTRVFEKSQPLIDRDRYRTKRLKDSGLLLRYRPDRSKRHLAWVSVLVLKETHFFKNDL